MNKTHFYTISGQTSNILYVFCPWNKLLILPSSCQLLTNKLYRIIEEKFCNFPHKTAKSQQFYVISTCADLISNFSTDVDKSAQLATLVLISQASLTKMWLTLFAGYWNRMCWYWPRKLKNIFKIWSAILCRRTISAIIPDHLEKKKVSFRWVQKILTDDHKMNRLAATAQFLTLYMLPFVNNYAFLWKLYFWVELYKTHPIYFKKVPAANSEATNKIKLKMI